MWQLGEEKQKSRYDQTNRFNLIHSACPPKTDTMKPSSPLTSPTLTPILSTLRTYVQQVYGVELKYFILFGSQARQEAQPDSDIDLLIVLDRPVDTWLESERTADFISQLCLQYSTVISALFVSIEQYQTQSTALLRNIAREGILL